MTREQQKSIIEFIARTACGCVTELDVEADAVIRALFVRNPDAAYRMTMLAMAQERELAARDAREVSPAVESAVGKPASVTRWLSGMLGRDERQPGEKVAATKLRG